MKSQSHPPLGEQQLIQHLTRRWKQAPPLIVGVGDDCAVLKSSPKKWDLLKTDTVVEGVHFTTKTKPEWIGRKAIARALSDIASMGGTPESALITLATPKGISVEYLDKIYHGIEKIAAQHGVLLVGGETTRSKQLLLSIAMTGYTKGYRPALRSTGKPGDLVWVTGRLGNTFPKKQFLFEPRLAEGKWLAENSYATSMMDVSDGLGADLPRLAKASKLGFKVDKSKIPKAQGTSLHQAINDGEDFELLFTTSPHRSQQLKKDWPFKLKITCIGSLITDDLSHVKHPEFTGFDHFA